MYIVYHYQSTRENTVFLNKKGAFSSSYKTQNPKSDSQLKYVSACYLLLPNMLP